MFQAESEDDLQSWMETFVNAKRYALLGNPCSISIGGGGGHHSLSESTLLESNRSSLSESSSLSPYEASKRPPAKMETSHRNFGMYMSYSSSL